jgi:hypothetical protein
MLTMILLALNLFALLGWGLAIWQLRHSKVSHADEHLFADKTLRENDRLLLENMDLRRQLAARRASPSELVRADPEYPTADPGGPF